MHIVPGSPNILALALVVYLVFVNVLTLAVYWLDKIRADQDLYRVPEQTLLLLAFFGGSPAALVARRWLEGTPYSATFAATLNLLLAAQIASGAILNTERGQALAVGAGQSAIALLQQVGPPAQAATHAGEQVAMEAP